MWSSILFILRLIFMFSASILLAGGIMHLAIEELESGLIYFGSSIVVCLVALVMEELSQILQVKQLQKQRVSVEELYGRENREQQIDEIKKGKKANFH